MASEGFDRCIDLVGQLLTELQQKTEPANTQTVSLPGTVTVDSELPAAVALAENLGNPTAPLIGACVLGFDGTTWDRAQIGGGVEATALRVTVASNSTGLLPVSDNAGSLTVDQATAANFNAQAVGELAHDAVDSGNPQKIGGRASTAQITAVASADRTDAIFDVHGRQMTRIGNQNFAVNQWTAIHVPAANTQATATKASAGAGVRNVCTVLTIVLAATGTAPTATNIQVNLIDGATGGTTYLWRATISIPATAGAMNGVALSNLWFVGTAATAMTLEFSAAGGANTIESVSMGGVTVAE